ncbi:unnamed protein product [Sympodiomycopsis kandeliae]
MYLRASLPCGATSRKLLTRNNKAFGFQYHEDDLVDDGQDDRDFRCNAVIVKHFTKTQDLDADPSESNAGVPCGRLFDYGNSRWADEPSEAKRRQASHTRALSADNAWTGTKVFLSRGALMMDSLASEDVAASDTDESNVKAQHRHWHDLESLALCYGMLLASRYRRFDRIRQILQDWMETKRTITQRSILGNLDAIHRELQLVGQRLQEPAGKEEIVVAQDIIGSVIDIMLSVASSRVVSEQEGQLFEPNAKLEEGSFASVLEVTNKMIAQLCEISSRFEGASLPSLSMGVPRRVLRSSTIRERVNVSVRSGKENVLRQQAAAPNSPSGAHLKRKADRTGGRRKMGKIGVDKVCKVEAGRRICGGMMQPMLASCCQYLAINR